jgi:hypothetical protein
MISIKAVDGFMIGNSTEIISKKELIEEADNRLGTVVDLIAYDVALDYAEKVKLFKSLKAHKEKLNNAILFMYAVEDAIKGRIESDIDDED